VIRDLRTVFWKEWRALVGGRARRQVLLTGGMLSIWAVWFPIQMGGRDFVADPVLMLILTITLPMVVSGIVVPDAIAGERERHTLNTLLASRLPDRAILYGKLGFGVAVGCLATPLMMAVGLVVANIVAVDAAPLFYDPAVLVLALTLSILVATLTGGIGIFVSLRASTAQEAQQLTLVGLMLPFMLAGFGAMALLSDRQLARDLIHFLGGSEAWLLAAAMVAALLSVDVVVVAAADRRFRRGRLTGTAV
jgi:ABC-2 type transport system permease protein